MTAARKAKCGDRYGRLLIVAAYVKKTRHGWQHLTKCDCGTIKLTLGKSMYRGQSQSCGCLQIERSTKHSDYGSPEYKSWCAMITRCTNENQDNYKNYGGRGISVCEEWGSYDAFLKDMGRKPSKRHSLERVDNDSNYCPENCIWADRFRQAQNQRMRADNKTGCKGVSFDIRKQKYIASINRDGVKTYLGTFANLDDAIAARRKHEETLLNQEK